MRGFSAICSGARPFRPFRKPSRAPDDHYDERSHRKDSLAPLSTFRKEHPRCEFLSEHASDS
jgi:hypothetical protein